MIPQQRKMIERLEGRPFTLLGINSDGDRSGLPTQLKESGVTWPQIHEGQDRAISIRWNVSVYPTIYILDHEGIIRRKGFLPEAEIEKTVDELLKAMEERG
ncbi:MAG: TlpA family protein disulfide reductase [Planctomycetota bacterium]|jgi:hypothetical protein